MTITLLTLGLLWLWATIAGLDLVSVLQTLTSRPLVVGPVAGWLVGDVEAGLRVGAVLELFALDVVPIGSSKYPDFGAATVGAVLFAAGTDWTVTLGAAVAIGVALATLGGTTLPMARRATAAVIRAEATALGEGDPTAIRTVHVRGLGHELVRSAGLGLLALATALALRSLELWPHPGLGRTLTNIALAGAAWAVAHGAVASARTGPRWRWAAVGLAAGTLVAWQR